MKKIIFLSALLLASLFSFSQSICTQTSCAGFQNSDLRQIYNAIRTTTSGGGGSATTVTVANTVTIAPATVSVVNTVTLSATTLTVSAGTVTIAAINAGPTLTLTSSIASTSGNTTSIAKEIAFVTSSDFSGTINAVSRLPNTSYSFSAPSNNQLPVIAYTIITGTITIDILR